jgi:hypothetical protein
MRIFGAESETVEDRLEEWRDAERQVGASEAGTARAKMARKQANHARDVFHEAEDAEREHQGDRRARKTESREAN